MDDIKVGLTLNPHRARKLRQRGCEVEPLHLEERNEKGYRHPIRNAERVWVWSEGKTKPSIVPD